MSRSHSYLPAEPVVRWIDDEIIPRYGSQLALARVLAMRTGIEPGSWARYLIRLRCRERIHVYKLDRLCIALGEHVSRFDPTYLKGSL